MIIGFIGDMGSGKTLTMTKFAYDYFKLGCNIYANYGLKFKYTPIDYSHIKNLNADLNNSIMCIDEIHVFIDSRASMREVNRYTSYFVTQSRKRNLIFFYTTQNIGQVDKRLRDNTNYKIYCKKIEKENNIFIRCALIDSNQNIKNFTIYANPIFNLYSTKEIINPFID